MSTLETKDIQGIVIRSYGSRKSARFYFLEIKDVQKARNWIGEISKEITNGQFKSEEERNNDKGEHYLNIGFTKKGMEVLRIKTVKESHNPSFDLGPLNPHTLKMLGDSGANDPGKWSWGRNDEDAIHILLMVYAIDKKALKSISSELENGFRSSELSIVQKFETHLNKENKEHFGFVDGVSQPAIEGAEGRQKDFPENIIKAGEFVLGYKNEYGRYAESPKISKEDDKKNLLRDAHGDNPSSIETKDLGMNGSYLVFRQLREDVKGFWDFVKKYTEEHPYGPSSKGPEFIGAKIFGRWTNGSPITLNPEQPGPPDKQNKFFYHENDLQGLKCPIGAHARRANPRDDFEQNPEKSADENRESSLAFTKKHRIIRRARPYGDPVADSMKLEDILKAPDDKSANRGIYFIVINADFGRQFEFIQQTWITSPEFRNLFSDPDPLMGSQPNEEANVTSYFTIQDSPVRQRIPNMRSFVTTAGSAYFFMPGIHALKYIAEGY